MIVRKLKDIRASDSNVKSDGWESARLLLKSDGLGFSFHVTTMFAGQELKMHYQNHLEAVLVLKGTGTIEDLGTGLTHTLSPGVLYALNANHPHLLRPTTDLLTSCVFNPPVSARRPEPRLVWNRGASE